MIRPARPQDAPAIAAIWNPIIRDTTLTFTNQEKTVQELEAAIAACQREGRAYLVAEEANTVLGFATYGQFRAGPGYAQSLEHTIHLAPGARGRGLGRALMLPLMGQAGRAGAHCMIAGISAENPQGAAFHRALGFALAARLPQVGRKFGRYIDLLLYQKFLS